MRVEHIGGATLYLGDCLEILPTLGKVDAVVTDPPYGIGYKTNLPGSTKRDVIIGDDARPNLQPIFDMDVLAIIFGANNFPELLPHRGRWICWDKRLSTAADRMLGSAFELAWVNKRSGFDEMFRVLHGGVVNADGAGLPRDHPTQKPIALMELILNAYPKPQTILDPFMGSGTTGVACANLGRKFIGIEIDEGYFDIACQRIEQAYAQTDIIHDLLGKPEQTEIPA